MKKEIITVVELTGEHIKLVQSKVVRGRRLINVCEVRKFQDYTDEEVKRLMTEVLLSKRIQSDNLILILPRQQCILKQMELPSHAASELKKMAGLQLVNQIPYSLEDIIFDVHILESNSSGYTKLLAVMVHKEIIDKFLTIVKKLNLSLGKVVVSSFGILGWLGRQAQKKIVAIDQPIAVVSIDFSHTEVCFCQNKTLFFSRSFKFGARDLKGDNLIGLVNQVELSLGTYTKENMGPEIKRIVIVSDLEAIDDLVLRLENIFKIPVNVLSSWSNVLSQKNINLSSLKGQVGVTLTASTGILMSDAKDFMNLTPEEVHDTKRSKIQKKEIIKLILLFVVGMTMVSSIFGFRLYNETTYYNKLEDKAEELQVIIKKAQKKIDFVEAFEKELQGQIFVPDLILELYQQSLPEISFRSLYLDANGSFTIQGYGQTSGSVNSFQSRLLKSTLFQNVSLQFATKRKIFNQEVTDFKITSTLRGKE